MKKVFFLFATVTLIVLSCNKDKKEEPADEIIYNSPDNVSVSTIRSYYTSMNPFCGELPLPDDSLAVINIDLDGDQADDFSLEVKHYLQELTQYCGHCGIFHIKTINVKPLSGEAFISLDTASKYWIRYYNETEIVSADDEWSQNTVTALLEDGCMIPTVNFSDTYFGLKYKNMLGWMHVQRSGNNGLVITGFACNKTAGRPIKTGQTE